MKSVIVLALTALCISWAVPAFCESPTLWQDPQTGQLYAKPADGRVPVDAEKDLNLPASVVSNLYEDESGAVYSKPGPGRTRIAGEMATPSTTAAQSSTAPADYSSEAFKDAVTHIIGEKESNTYPKVKVGGLFYGEYLYDFDKDKANPDGSKGGRNQFTLNRGYLNVFADMTPQVGARFTSDITRLSSGTSSNTNDWELRVKYAYVDFHNFLNAYPSLEVKMGQYQTAWLDYEEGLWEYRVIDPMIIEKEGFFNSADLGVGLKGKLPAGHGDWQVDVINGEGYHNAEQNKYKTVQARMTIIPIPQVELLKGLQFTGFASTGREKDAVVNGFNKEVQRDRYIAFLGYKYKDDLFVGGEYDFTHGTDSYLAAPTRLVPAHNVSAGDIRGEGYSFLAWYRMPFWRPLRIVGRYDMFNHDTAINGAKDTRWIYGVSCDVSKNAMIVLDNERTIADKYISASKQTDENLMKVDVQWTF